MSEKLDELEAKITTELENRLSEAIRNRNALPERGFNPKFWKYQAEVISLISQIGRRKGKNESTN